jgi:MoaA/NifB/PqqE/SkfB family radical SAM enzyme
MGTRQFLFSGAGEPFLHGDALEFMGRVKGAGCATIVNTNGTLLDSLSIDELIKMGCDELRITTMAGNRDTYAKTHVGVPLDTFDHLNDNLRFLAERKAALGVRRPEVTLVSIAVAQNYDGIFHFIEFARSVRADRVCFRPIHDWNDPGLVNLMPTPKQSEVVIEQLHEAKDYLESGGMDHNIGDFLKVFQKKIDTMKLYNVMPCYYGWLSVRIDVNGQAYPCCNCFNTVGTVEEKGFHEIWNGEAYLRFREEAVTINTRKIPVTGCLCNNCSHYIANFRVFRALHPYKARLDRSSVPIHVSRK